METCCEVKEAVPEDTIIIHIPVYLCWTHTASQPPLPSAYKGDHNTNMLNDEEDNPTNFRTSPAELKGPYSCQSSALWTSCCFSQGSPQWVNSLYQPYIFLPLILQNELPVLDYEVHKPPLGLFLVPALGILLQMCSLSLLSICPVLSLDCSPLLPKHPASAVPYDGLIPEPIRRVVPPENLIIFIPVASASSPHIITYPITLLWTFHFFLEEIIAHPRWYFTLTCVL